MNFRGYILKKKKISEKFKKRKYIPVVLLLQVSAWSEHLKRTLSEIPNKMREIFHPPIFKKYLKKRGGKIWKKHIIHTEVLSNQSRYNLINSCRFSLVTNLSFPFVINSLLITFPYSSMETIRRKNGHKLLVFSYVCGW